MRFRFFAMVPVLALLVVLCGLFQDASISGSVGSLIRIRREAVVLEFPSDITVADDVVSALLTVARDDIRFAEDFLEHTLKKPVTVSWIGSAAGIAPMFAKPGQVILYAAPPLTVKEAEGYKGRLAHEFTHLVSYECVKGRPPASVHEGVAIIVANRAVSASDHRVAAGLLASGRLPLLRQLLMMRYGDMGFDAIVMYYGNASFFSFIEEMHGHSVLLRLFKEAPDCSVHSDEKVQEKLIFLIEECTLTSLDRLEREWHDFLRTVEVSQRYINSLLLREELDVDLYSLFWLSDRTGRKINGEFLTEYTDLIDSIARYGAGEDNGVTEEDLRRRIQALREWATEMRRRMRGI